MSSLLKDLIKNMKSKNQQECIRLLEQISLNDSFDVDMLIYKQCPECDDRCDTLLMLASQEGLLEVVKYIIEVLKADPDIQDNYGWNALHEASWGGHTDIIDYLINCAKSDPNIQSKDKDSVLHRAVRQYKVESVRVLLKSDKISLDLRNFDGHTALELARIRNYYDIVNIILNYQLNVSNTHNK